MSKFVIRTFSMFLLFVSSSFGVMAEPLPLKQFLESTAKNDGEFEAILIDQLSLQHRRQQLLPDSDLIFDVKYRHNFYLNQDRNNPEASLSLSRLFPESGTELSVSYSKDSSVFTTTDTSNLEVLISQPIAKNAFGNAIEIQDKIIGVENEVIRFQIVEAYEDYLASLTTLYHDWYAAYQNLELGRQSLRSNEILMDNILERQRQKIALPVDVNKIRLLILARKENLISLREIYETYSNLIHSAIDESDSDRYTPVDTGYTLTGINLEEDTAKQLSLSRSYKIYKLLEKQNSLEVDQIADDLMPSTELLLGYRLDGTDFGIESQQDDLFIGISASWPIGQSVNRAKKQIAEIALRKTQISNENKLSELEINLKNIGLQIKRQQKLLDIAEDKIKLSESILKDEAENYSFGKITLNDYITATNRVDDNRFSQTAHKVELNKLAIEWLRLSDRLVDETILK